MTEDLRLHARAGRYETGDAAAHRQASSAATSRSSGVVQGVLRGRRRDLTPSAGDRLLSSVRSLITSLSSTAWVQIDTSYAVGGDRRRSCVERTVDVDAGPA